MSAEPVLSPKDDSLAEVSDTSRRYFEKRDELEEAKADMLAAMMEATAEGATQMEIAAACDHTDRQHPLRQFHRTRIQQLLQEARRGRP